MGALMSRMILRRAPPVHLTTGRHTKSAPEDNTFDHTRYMLDNANMAAHPVQISMEEDLLARLDAQPEVKARGRSAVVRRAVEAYLRASERRRIDEELLAAYDGQADEMLREIEDFLGAQAWPDE